MNGNGAARPRPARGISSAWIAKGNTPVNYVNLYNGTAHADGFTGFNGLFGAGKAHEQACLVHVRRKFVDEFERTGFEIAKGAIERIPKLYVIEKMAKRKAADARVDLRTYHAMPIFDELEIWLAFQLPLAEAIRYTLGRLPKART